MVKKWYTSYPHIVHRASNMLELEGFLMGGGGVNLTIWYHLEMDNEFKLIGLRNDKFHCISMGLTLNPKKSQTWLEEIWLLVTDCNIHDN